MKVSLFSNFFNAHQLPLAQELSRMDDVEFSFVSLMRTDGITGRDSLDSEYSYVLSEYSGASHAQEAMSHALEDDVVIFGDMAGKEHYVEARANTGKLFFRYAERLLKRGDWWRFAPPKIYRTWNQFTKYKGSNMYVLCASAYTARDLSLFGLPVEKCFKWGYFPDVNRFCSGHEILRDVNTICSVQRLVPYKRVDLQIRLASELKAAGHSFHFRIVGDGPERVPLERLAAKLGVCDCIEFLGELSRDDAQKLMESSAFFLATSNRREGWGATINEAMAAGCCVVASKEMGSVPFLLQDGFNGVVIDISQFGSFSDKVSRALNNQELSCLMGKRAVETIADEWCAKVAATRLMQFCRYLQVGEEPVRLFDKGPMSPSFIRNY